MYPKSVEDLINAFSRLPGVGKKTAERYAFTLLDWSQQNLGDFQKAVKNISHIHKCSRCGNISENDLCDICKDSKRNSNVICVVASPKDVQAIESLNIFNGVYHVLGGTINTAKGILPEDIRIPELLERVADSTEEIILALDPTIDGETTALYITKMIPGDTRVTRLAQGIPMGSKLDYADPRTLSKAFNGRKE